MLKKILKLPYRVAQWFSKGVLMSAFLLALLLSVLTVSSQRVFDAVSGWAETVIGQRSVRARVAKNVDAVEAERDTASQALAAAEERAAALAVAAEERQGNLETALERIAALEADLENAKKVTYAGTETAAAAAVGQAAQAMALGLETWAERQAKTLPARALPFAGVAVNAEQAAANLASACAAMQTLADLDNAFDTPARIDAASICDRKTPDTASLWLTVRTDPGAAWAQSGSALAFRPDAAYEGLMNWGARLYGDLLSGGD